MANYTSENTYVRISNDGMEAYLYLAIPKDRHEYTITEIHEILLENKVVFGIIEEKLNEIIEKGIYYREILIAKGIRQVDGVAGQYEYKFNTNPSGKPVIREDGTVDYWSVFTVQTVAKGDIIAIYNPPITGIQGKTVTGKIVEPKRGKELLPLKGKGFQCDEDKRTYVAVIDGKIEYQNDRIMISNLLEIKGDLDFNTGRIDFRGDVVIHGNVESGSYIKSGGSVTIDGNVEATTIVSAKDVILRKGMQGGGKATIQSGGNIFAKFIEGSHVEAKRDIQADILMNSTIIAGERILISGKKATIIGGNVRAITQINALVVGNEAQKQTNLSVGVDEKEKTRMLRIKTVFGIIDQKLEEINKELSELKNKKEEGPQFARERMKERAKKLLRNKIKYITDKATFTNELEDLESKIKKSKRACIVINKCVYPGVTIKTNSASIHIEEKQYAMEYRCEGGEVAMHDLHNG